MADEVTLTPVDHNPFAPGVVQLPEIEVTPPGMQPPVEVVRDAPGTFERFTDPYASSRLDPTRTAPPEELREYRPTPREEIAQFLRGEHPSVTRERIVREGMGTGGMGLVDLTPVGAALGAQEAFQRGDYQTAAMGLIPGAGRVAGAAERTAGGAVARAAAEAASGRGPAAGSARDEVASAISRAQEVARGDQEGSPGGYRRGVGSAPGTLGGIIHEPKPGVAAAWAEGNISAPTFVELPPEQAGVFQQAISAAKAAHPHGAAVTVYPDYSGMRTFITPDGTAGFALNGDDIVSVFRHPSSPYKRTTIPMLDLATSQGGRRLDAFDTQLPHLYARSGFRAVSRVPWNDEYAPEGWSHKEFNAYNQGRPDVVAMVHDPGSMVPYRPGERPYAPDYDTMIAHQRGMLPDVVPEHIASTRPYFFESGYPVKGRGFDKAADEAWRRVGQYPKGYGPIDLSNVDRVANVPQKDLPRYDPTLPRRHGVSERLTKALQNPYVYQGVGQSIEAGMRMGAHRWYWTEPIRRAFEEEFGPDKWQEPFKRFMDLQAAASPRSDVSTQIRNGSWLYSHDRRGLPLPEKGPGVYPYGHLASDLHRKNYEAVTGGGWDLERNPKPPSYSENLQGNLEPATIDAHAWKNIAMRTGDPDFLENNIRVKVPASKEPTNFQRMFGEVEPDGKRGGYIVTFRPRQLYDSGRLTMHQLMDEPTFWSGSPNDNEYQAAEHFYKQLADRYGLKPAEAQAAAWAGAGKLTGLESPPDMTFPELLNERIMYTAFLRGQSPHRVLRDMIRGHAPLLGLAGFGMIYPRLFDMSPEDHHPEIHGQELRQ